MNNSHLYFVWSFDLKVFVCVSSKAFNFYLSSFSVPCFMFDVYQGITLYNRTDDNKLIAFIVNV